MYPLSEELIKKQEILAKAQVMLEQREIEAKVKEIAKDINQEIAQSNDLPIFLTVMNGGMFFAVHLLSNIEAPVQMDYIHASRYNNQTRGAEKLEWYYTPSVKAFVNRTVYIVDDLLDEGNTLLGVSKYLLDHGARECKLVVLINKDLGRDKVINADHVGFTLPNLYLFGYGMDIYGMYRQLPKVYAIKV